MIPAQAPPDVARTDAYTPLDRAVPITSIAPRKRPNSRGARVAHTLPHLMVSRRER
jgi:hypothetical protein